MRINWRAPLILTHRWLGIAGCLLFIAWFFSGIVMMYARMPVLLDEERLARAAPLDLSRATIPPAQAAELVGLGVERIQAGMLGGRPVYRFGGREQYIVYADTGDFFGGLERTRAEWAARRFAPGHQGPFRYDAYLTQADQWTIGLQRELPMHRFALDDDAGTELYVSDVTGDVVLRTTARERFWAYLGPVTHWVYFTPFRRNGLLWSEFVIWSSVIGCVMCVSGLIWGLLRVSPFRRYRLKGQPVFSPYVGMLKWHHYAGLLFGVVTLTWAYSGLLSMGPFNWFQTTGITSEQRAAATGGPVRAELLTLESMRAAVRAFAAAGMPPRELDVVQFRGEPFWAADRAPGEAEIPRFMDAGLLPRAALPRLERRYVSAAHPGHGVIAGFDPEAMPAIARAAMPGTPVRDEVWLNEYDGYYYDPRGTRPLPVLRVRYADPQETWLYFDPARGGVVQKSDRVSRLRRWLYQGFHSLDFPFLYFQRPLWDIVVIALSIGGLASSVTVVAPAWRRLAKHARRLRSAVLNRAWNLL